MKDRITHYRCVIVLAVVALSIFCFPQGQIHGHGLTRYDKPEVVELTVIAYASVGLAPGQTLRFTLFNPDGTPVRAQVRVHSGGVLVAMGDGSVRGGAFHSFDFKRSDISLPGEAGTGRSQLLISCAVGKHISRAKIDEFAATLEVIEDSSGRTIVAGDDLLIGGNTSHDQSGFANDILIGIVPGQSLRVTLFNPQSPGSRFIPSRVKLFETNGNLIAQSPDLVIPPGETRSFEFDRDDLPLPGEPRTDRLQVRARLEAATDTPSLISIQTRSGLITMFEVIEKSTGKTVTLAGQQCLVFFLGGKPDN